MKTAVSIPDDVFRSAERLGVSRSRLYADALARLLAQQDRQAITAKLDEVYSRQPSGLDPALRAARHKALPKEDW